MMNKSLPAVLLTAFCVFAITGCCQREKPPVKEPVPPAPAAEAAEDPGEAEETGTAIADPLDFDEPTDLDVDVQIDEEDEGAEVPGVGDDITVE